MILADKIIDLRKKSGMSQEELASELGVSRQSVSKWESIQSIPDIDKIIAMSKIFGVSTDYLLKDDVELNESEIVNSSDNNYRKVTMEMANDFINKKNQTAFPIALGVLICILSPITLIILAELSEYKNLLSENLAGGMGVITLLLLVAIAVSLFLISGNKTKEYEFLEKEPFETEYGVTGMLKEKKKAYDQTYFMMTLVGVILCIISVIPLLVSAFTENELFIISSVGILLGIVSIGVFLIVYAGNKMGAYVRLLQEGDYSLEKKTRNPVLKAISGAYWLVVTAVYLIWSFTTNDWELTWIVWVIGGILYGAIFGILNSIYNNKNNNN